MKATPTALPDVLLIEPVVFGDDRGYFLEAWNAERYAEVGLPRQFVQDNLSRSVRGVLRGLHSQNPGAQGKLVYAVHGEIFDVAVDVRRGSPSFGRWVGVTLSSRNRHQLYVPPGFVHGFCVVSESALLAYKCTTPYRPEAELGVVYNDPDIGIEWPVENPLLSTKDAGLPRLRDITPDRLPRHDG